MSEKRDPLIRAMIVIIVGTIAFGLLFSLFNGGGNMDNMGGSGYSSLSVSLGGLLVLLVKLLLVVLVIAVVVGVVIWIKNSFFKNSSSKFIQSISNDPILKTVSLVILGIIGLVILMAVLGSFTNTGMGYGYNGGSMYGGAAGLATSLNIAGIMSLLIKVLSFVLVISLILALAAYIKKQFDTGAFKINSTAAQSTVAQDTATQSTSTQTAQNTATQKTTEEAN